MLPKARVVDVETVVLILPGAVKNGMELLPLTTVLEVVLGVVVGLFWLTDIGTLPTTNPTPRLAWTPLLLSSSCRDNVGATGSPPP